MSEFINNGEFRKNTLKNIIKKLHNGAKVEDVKKEFEDVFANVSVSEITNVENELVKEGIKGMTWYFLRCISFIMYFLNGTFKY